jgi:hypothetical protein
VLAVLTLKSRVHVVVPANKSASAGLGWRGVEIPKKEVE